MNKSPKKKRSTGNACFLLRFARSALGPGRASLLLIVMEMKQTQSNDFRGAPVSKFPSFLPDTS
ncbi:MAG: hypothetical protein FJ398_03575 [Verrucomicrobia bacterium]|nr:hypothetical protein [Verrucomicrobiota bacterium]